MKNLVDFYQSANKWEWELGANQPGVMNAGVTPLLLWQCEASCSCAELKYQTWSVCLLHSCFAQLSIARVRGWGPKRNSVWAGHVPHGPEADLLCCGMWRCHLHHGDKSAPRAGGMEAGCAVQCLWHRALLQARCPRSAQAGAAAPPQPLPNREHPIMWGFWGVAGESCHML